MYVLDYNNNLNVELVVIFKLNFECIPKKVTFINNSLNNVINLQNEINFIKDNDSTINNNNSSSSSSDNCCENINKSNNKNNKYYNRTNNYSKMNSFKFSLIVFLLNVYYLFISLYMNKFLINLINFTIKLLNYDFILAILLLSIFQNIKSKKRKNLIFSTIDYFILNMSNRQFKKNDKHTHHKFKNFIFYYLCVFVFFFIFYFYSSNQV